MAGLVAAGALWWRSHPADPIPETGWSAVVKVLAGDGVSGIRDGHGSSARFSEPFGVAVSADHSIYIADAGDAHRIRRISQDGTVATVAGGVRGFADGPAFTARFDTPSHLAAANGGILYIADTGNNAIRRMTSDGIVSTVAGQPTAGFDDGAGHDARFNGPVGIAVDATGRVIVADTYNDRIRAIHPDGRVTTIAGSGATGAADGRAWEATFNSPSAVAVDATGGIYVADTGNDAVRLITPDGLVTTIMPGGPGGLVRPAGIAVTPGGTVYVSDGIGRIFERAPDGAVRTLAGSGPGFADGTGEAARFRSLAGLALDGIARLVVADSRNTLVRLVASPGRSDVRPPAAPWINPRFDGNSFTWAPLVWPVAPMEGPFEITGTMGESRGIEGAERFHAGLDVQAPEGTAVRAVRDGVVVDPVSASAFGTLNESVRIGPLAYVHLRAGRDRRDERIDTRRFAPAYDGTGQLAGMRLKRGARFTAGDVIGTVNAFNHVHMNIGWPGEEQNPLLYRLVHFKDTVPPTIARGGVRVFREDGQPLTARRKRRLIVDGRVHIVVDAWDRVDGNQPRRRLGLYELGYQILNRDGMPASGFEAPRQTIRFDRMSSQADARLIYAPGSGIPVYGRRSTRFLYAVTSTLQGGSTAQGAWDTEHLPPGDYIIRIVARDIRGNEAIANRDLPVTIVPRQSE
jgi:sugar lactone lactonase YvrE